MSFVNPESFKIGNQLRRAHFTFSRAKPLKAAFSRRLEDQFRSQLIEGVEARGIVVTGNSRVGKSRELKKLINDFNASETQMPDGKPAKVVSCVLSGRVSFKDLGVRTLSALGYEPRRTRTQAAVPSSRNTIYGKLKKRPFRFSRRSRRSRGHNYVTEAHCRTVSSL